MVDFHHTALDVQLTSVANYWGGGFLLNTVMLVRARGRVCVYICRVWAVSYTHLTLPTMPDV